MATGFCKSCENPAVIRGEGYCAPCMAKAELREAQFVASCSEGAYYFDWQVLIDNPVSTLENAIAHEHAAQRREGFGSAGIPRLRVALREVELCE